MMSSHAALPREEHLQQVLHIFSYLDKFNNTELVFNPSDPIIKETNFERKDLTCSEYGHVEGEEVLPENMPAPRGLGFTMRGKVDADHAGDSVSRRSRTGFLMWLNSSLIHWFSKKQGSVESSSHGSEFVALKQCCEYIVEIR